MRSIVPVFCGALLGFALGAAAGGEGPNGFSLEKLRVPARSIRAGGPQRDQIPSVDAPRFAALPEVKWARPVDAVLGVALGGEARAYPVHLIERHQVVNDALGGVPVAVTYDPLTHVPRVFRRRVGARELHFGVSGLLHNGSFLLHDRETGSLWLQFTGEAIAGPLAGERLARERVRHETLASWAARRADTQVLEPPEPKRFDYRYSPYRRYWVADEIPFPVAAEDRRFHAKEVVVGVAAGGKARAYLGSRVTAAGGSLQDSFEGQLVEIRYSSEDGVFRWEIPPELEVTEAYWFAWKAFHPETGVWEPRGEAAGGDGGE